MSSSRRVLLCHLCMLAVLCALAPWPVWASKKPMLHSCSGEIPYVTTAYNSCREVYENEFANDDSATLSRCVTFADGGVSACERWRVLVILIDNTDQSAPEPIPLISEAATLVEGLIDYYEDNSYGKLTLRLTFAGDAPRAPQDHTAILGESGSGLSGDWVTRDNEKSQLPHCPTLGHLNSDGVDLFQFHKFVWLYTKNVGGGATGNGEHAEEVNCPDEDPPFNLGVKGVVRSKEWRFGRDGQVDLTAHELGHAMGEDHANSLSSKQGTQVQYGDESDAMGFYQGHFKAEVKSGQGWLDETMYVEKPPALTGSEETLTVKLDGLENRNVLANPEKKALKIGLEPSLGTDDPNQPGHLWVEARRSGSDYRWRSIDSWNLHDGVIVRKKLEADLHSTTVDATPETGQDKLRDGALLPGRTFSDGPIHITVTGGVTGSLDGFAEIEVHRRGDNAGPNAAPTASISARRCGWPTGRRVCPQEPHNESLAWSGPTWKFDAGGSTDPDGDGLVYFWNFEVGDNFHENRVYGADYEEGDYASGQVVVHRFRDSSNPRRVWLTVSDKKGGTAQAYFDHPLYSPVAPDVKGVTGVRTKGETYRFIGHGVDDNDDMLKPKYTLPDGSEVFDNYALYEFPNTSSSSVTFQLDDGSATDSMIHVQQLERSWAGPIVGCTEEPTRRINATIAVDESISMAVLFGGIRGGNRNNETWIWRAATRCWEQATNRGTFVPTGRSGSMMAFDDVNDEFVVFGGDDGTSLLDETYTMTVKKTAAGDYEAWWILKQVVSPRPIGRKLGGLVQPGPGRDLLLFGGVINNTGPIVTDEAWKWNGKKWTATAGGPAPRARHVMTFDVHTDQVVIFGGELNGGGLDGQTWVWNPDTAAWIYTGTLGPPARKNAMMTYDPRVERTVLYGGEDATGNLGDIWEWTGTRWLDWSVSANPISKRSAAMVFVEGGRDPDTLLVFAGRTTVPVKDTYDLRPDLQ